MSAETKEKKEVKVEETVKPKIVLMGDSICDSFLWLEDPTNNLTVQLRQLMPDYEVVNLAVDQMTTFDMECRKPWENSWKRYQIARTQAFTTPETKNDVHYPVHSDGNIYSFENLRQVASLPGGVKVVVLSVGGNDLYLRAEMQKKLLTSLVPGKGYLRDEEAKLFAKRYQEILHKISLAAPDALIIPVVPYHPHFQFSLACGTTSGTLPWLAKQAQYLFLSKLVSPLVKEILVAVHNSSNRDSMHIIDLSKTFDPEDETDYGTGAIDKSTRYASWSGAEPSCKSTGYITQLIKIATELHTENILKNETHPHVLWLDKKAEEIRGVKISPENITRYKFGPW